MILHLTPGFKPIQGEEVAFESFTFSGGEPHIKIKSSINSTVSITTRINSFNDLGLLCMAVDALKQMDVSIETIYIPYFPAARQDRLMIPGEPLSVKVYANIINGLGAKNIVILDAHSDVTPALIENCVAVPNHAFIAQVIKAIGKDVILISPDGGALKKIYKLSDYLGGIEVVECSKSRDVKTGKLNGFKVYADDLEGKTCLIVDDICDGGGTFNGLAEELKKKNASDLFLAVTHGIFSKGFEELSGYFTQIYATDSVRELEHLSFTQIRLDNGLLS